MKRLFSMLVVVCLVFVGGIGTFSTSAIEITPFASPVISDVSYSISASKYSVNVSLNESFSGTITMNIQKSNGSWQNHTNICSSSSFSSRTIYKSGSCSLEKGTYRISVTVTINGVNYTTNTGSVIIS